MSTCVSVNTYTYSVIYVTEEMMRSLKDIIQLSGLSLTNILNRWESVENAIHTWLSSKTLEKVTLEVYSATTNKLVVRWDFDIEYSYSSGDDGSLWADADAIRHAIQKAGAFASTCRYEFKLFAPRGSSVAGWGPGSYRSTDGFSRYCVGTTIGANSLASTTSFWRKP
jgi:HORMA domain-containing protein